VMVRAKLVRCVATLVEAAVETGMLAEAAIKTGMSCGGGAVQSQVAGFGRGVQLQRRA
jgi:hypothetical protein